MENISDPVIFPAVTTAGFQRCGRIANSRQSGHSTMMVRIGTYATLSLIQAIPASLGI